MPPLQSRRNLIGTRNVFHPRIILEVFIAVTPRLVAPALPQHIGHEHLHRHAFVRIKLKRMLGKRLGQAGGDAFVYRLQSLGRKWLRRERLVAVDVYAPRRAVDAHAVGLHAAVRRVACHGIRLKETADRRLRFLCRLRRSDKWQTHYYIYVYVLRRSQKPHFTMISSVKSQPPKAPGNALTRT